MAKKKRKKRNNKGILIMIILITFSFCGIKVVSNLFNGTSREALYPIKYEEYVNKYSEEFGVDKYLIYSIIKQESNFNEEAVSGAGAKGLMQITQNTFWWLSSKMGDSETSYDDINDPELNIKYGTFFVSILQEEFSDIGTICAAYNAGMNITNKWLQDSNYSNDGITLYKIPYEETSNYVDIVKDNYNNYKDIYAQEEN